MPENVTIPDSNETRHRARSQNAGDVSRQDDGTRVRLIHHPAGSQTHTHLGEWGELVHLKGEEV